MDEEQQKLAEELLFSGKQRPSFAKALYFGQFDNDRVFPFPEAKHQEKQRVEAFVEVLHNWCERELDADAIDRNAEIPRRIITALGELGVLGMTIPREYGGQGYGQYGYCKALEMLARYCGSTALFVNAHQSIGLKAILLYGTDEQKAEWLPILARGEAIAAFALTEPTAGSDAAGIKTRATFDPANQVWSITGQKQWITNGSIADVLTVMARTEIETDSGVEDKITAFLVTPKMKGFQIKEKALEKVGMRGTWTSLLAFDDMKVPHANILGPVGKGLRACLTCLDFGRTTFGATCTGSAKECYERALAHAKSRVQFGRPLASFDLVKAKLAKMAALIYAMEAATYLTAGFIDRDQEDVMLETAMIKVFNSEAQWQILYDAMQIFGGRSFFTDLPLERMMRDARLNMIGEGSNEVLRAFIGLVGMRDVGMQLKDVGDALKQPVGNMGTLWRFAQRQMGRLALPHVKVKSRHLQPYAKTLAKGVRSFGNSILRALTRYREEVMEKQLVLDRVATAAMALYTATATLSRLDMELARNGDDVDALDEGCWAAATLYLEMAFRDADHASENLFDEMDDQITEASDKLTGTKTAATTT